MNDIYKRYLLISCNWYYPNGGIFDVEDSVETEQEAMDWYIRNKEALSKMDCPSVTIQVFDCDQRKLFAKWSSES